MLLELTVLCLCLIATMVLLASTLLKRINARQEVRAKEYLFIINRTVSFVIRGFADYAAVCIIIINLGPNVSFILDPPVQRHCAELSINEWQLCLEYSVVGLSSLAILDCLIVSFAVGRLTKTDILATLVCYCTPLYFFGILGLDNLSYLASRDETVLTICYRQDHSIAMSTAERRLCRRRFLSFLFLFCLCAIVHVVQSLLTRLAAEMVVSIFKDSKRGVDKDKSDVLEP